MDTLTVTVDTATKALGIGRTTLYAMIASNQLQTIKIGRRRLIRTDSIRALVNQAA